MSGSGKDVLGMVGLSWNEVRAGTFPDKMGLRTLATLAPRSEWECWDQAKDQPFESCLMERGCAIVKCAPHLGMEVRPVPN